MYWNHIWFVCNFIIYFSQKKLYFYLFYFILITWYQKVMMLWIRVESNSACVCYMLMHATDPKWNVWSLYTGHLYCTYAGWKRKLCNICKTAVIFMQYGYDLCSYTSCNIVMLSRMQFANKLSNMTT